MPNKSDTNPQSGPNKPVQEIRLGSVKAVIWQNETTAGTRYNVQMCRLYHDGEQWHTTDSFGRDDLPLVAKVADMAHTWIFERNKEAA